jgi:hypothetical protein
MTAELKKSYGKATAWKKYGDEGGIYVDVDFSNLGFTNIPYINTYLTSSGGSIWKLTGVTSIYNLTNKSFRVYISHSADLK